MAGNVAVECFVSIRKDITHVKSEHYEQNEQAYNCFALWCFNDEGLFSDGIIFCSVLPVTSTKFFRHVQCFDLCKLKRPILYFYPNLEGKKGPYQKVGAS